MMLILALTSLFKCLESITISGNTYRMRLLEEINKHKLKETITTLLDTLTRLGTKFDNDGRVKSEKENIRIYSSKIEYIFMESLIADDLRFHTISSAAWQFDYMNKRLLAILRYYGQLNRNLKDEMSEDDHFPSSTADSLSSSEVAVDNKDNLLPVGLEQFQIQLLVELTGSTRKLELVGIVGMAGIGKTTLAKMIFHDPRVVQHFDIRAWVKSSQSQSKSDMLLQVLKCINQQRNNDILDQTETDLEETVYKVLKRQRYLIVVDDLWSAQEWNETRRLFSDDLMGSRILFTSRQSNVMEDLNCEKIHQMSLLGDKTSWDLLQKRVFSHDTCPPDLIDIGEQIAKKCEGLPLAIVVIAGILQKTGKKVESWKRIAESISSLALSSENPCQEIIALSYKYLPAHLKSCFLYMGAFPGGGSEIESRALARLWIAEGFITPRYSDNLEQVADGYLKDLIDRSLVLTTSKRFNGNVKTCRLHDLLLEFCIKQAEEEKFLDVIKDNKEEEEEEDSEGEERIAIYEKNHRPCRYSFHCNTFGGIRPKSQACTALFTVSSREVSDILLYDLDFKLLVVLSMIPLRFDSFPEEQLCRFLLLEYLALTASFELPSVVFRLLKLQTLIVNDSRIKSDATAAPKLPLEFWESTNLRHVELQVANYLPPPPVDKLPVKFLINVTMSQSASCDDALSVNQMLSLRTLSKVTLFSCHTRESLAGILNVTKLGVCETMEDFHAEYLWNRFFQNLIVLSHLETLKLYCLQMNNCTPRVLPIPGPNAFPVSLRKLTLSRSHLPWEKMIIMSELPNLEVLKLRNYAFQGTDWETKEGGFQCLTYLLIENTDLVNWSLEGDDCFPRLERLVLKFCSSLEEIPEQIGDIPNLSYMELRFCSNSAEQSVKNIQAQQEEECCHSIEVHIQKKL